MMKRILILFLVIPAFYGARGIDDLSLLLPDTLSYEGISTYKSPTLYNEDDLYILIDGGADVYYEYGFNRVLHTVYQTKEEHRIEVYIYEMKDVPAAFGIFSHTRAGSGEKLSSGSFIQVAASQLYELVQKDQYFIVVSWSDPSEEMVEMTGRMTTEITNNIKDPNPLPDLIGRYIEQGYSCNQLKYIRGTLGLSPIYFFSHKDIFGIQEAVCVKEDPNTLIDFYYQEAHQAEQQFANVKEEFAASKRIIKYEDGGNFIKFEDKRGRQIKISQADRKITAQILAVNSEGEIIALPDGF